MKYKKEIFAIGLIVIIALGIFLISRNSEKPIPEKQTDTARYFLSQVDLVENRYTPSLIKCLFNNKGREIYQQWSGIYYPDNPAYEVSLVRVEFNDKETSLSESCFIKEIKTMEDWQEVETKYNFSKKKFGK